MLRMLLVTTFRSWPPMASWFGGLRTSPTPLLIGEDKKGRRHAPHRYRLETNRFVDAFAEVAAAHLHAPRNITSLVVSAETAAAHAACLLGVFTDCANDHHITHPADAGGVATPVLRVSADRLARQ